MMEESILQDEVVVEEQIQEEVVKEKELSYEELKQQLEELKKKNESAEDIAKRLKDEKSQSKRQELENARLQEVEAKKNDFIASNIENILENNMNITEEQLASAKELGISKEQLKLMAYETKERLNDIYESSGGKEAYFNMVEAVKETASEEDVAMFKATLSNPATSKIALEALKYRYSQLGNNTNMEVDNRIVPRATVETQSSSYKDMKEYQMDMRKMRSLPSSQQQSYYAKIQDKLNRSNLV